jgi:hypothetical protein
MSSTDFDYLRWNVWIRSSDFSLSSLLRVVCLWILRFKELVVTELFREANVSFRVCCVWWISIFFYLGEAVFDIVLVRATDLETVLRSIVGKLMDLETTNISLSRDYEA